MNDISKILEGKTYKYSLCLRTDGADFANGINCSDPEKILELRCFDENGELRIFRSNVDADFQAREIIDGNQPELKTLSEQSDKFEIVSNDGYLESYDENHYLDIASVSSDGIVTATGGGKYFLPEPNAKLLTVRYYIKYDNNGIARKCDWRLVGFCEREEDKRCLAL